MSDRMEEKILNRTKAPSLNHVKNLNCWGWKINDLSIMRRMPSLRVLNLSVNDITSLQHLQDCHQLVELYLRRNKIQDLDELQYLKNLKYLRVIWLSNNPCVNIDNYRQKVSLILPQLEKLDNQKIPKRDDWEDSDHESEETNNKTTSKGKHASGNHKSRSNPKTAKPSHFTSKLNSEDLEMVILKAQEQVDKQDSIETHGSDNLDTIAEIE
ncbi:uncharacterized protein TRIADDRAFT_52163 [Trichoplax adhaerens]|uniref:U2A'/phosphoprotein 32 family A C-terminal domain-containing protein n=1 Tax=Trichoplax adhaerens TaxID=10228 RepID=B3RLY1_TRIAD|nr:hypothetical protein TRIADDRAFT_52163 [Trichoplax adhaerens]EDV28865.1 hypothetical protein TRIADDRAFT_52163 [Trichoplax adhaerens]|eukprot:XP_002108067.1 hypothetical protein TRIADDRAFT_52163 [Trichoplax adhaerens]